jgi:hypothetical protein
MGRFTEGADVSADHPYRRLPSKAFWRRSVAGLDPAEIDPVGRFTLSIGPETKVATAGSCFAQNIARYLRNSGYCYYVAEQAHPLISPEIALAHNYSVYSARYGNIYTTRQLLQLMQRVLGLFAPQDDCWHEVDSSVVDPFRPSIQPGGFVSEAAMRADRAQHLTAVRRMFEDLDVFVFTLGLTEGWLSTVDGAAYPICPGVDGGRFDPERYCFHNQTVFEVVEDLRAFLEHLRALNPRARVVLTVSPVPLVATAVPDQHVLSATTYSKSVLRVAAETIAQADARVSYFPSYEIITSAASRGRYYASDLRNVTEEGVAHVMRVFMHHATTGGALPISAAAPPPRDDFLDRVDEVVELICDEEKLAM